MKNFLILLVTFLFTSIVFSQICPQGTRWDNVQKVCLKTDIPENMDVVNFQCPNGYSWVSFKRECLTNKKVKDIYDSLRIVYLNDPSPLTRKSTPTLDSNPKSTKKSKRKRPEPVKEVPPAPVTTTAAPAGSITISQNDFNELREELLTLKSEVTEIKETNQQIQQDLVTFRTLINESNIQTSGESETIIASVSADDINFLKNEISSYKTQVAQMQELVNTLQEQQNRTANAFRPGVQNSAIKQNDVYGQNEVKFKIECPNGYKWVNEESICLRNEAFSNRSFAKAADPNATIDYGIRDVKCPKFFLWSSKSQNCIPTMHAAVKD